jgi:GNAT superfamily N-acetyltransferase
MPIDVRPLTPDRLPDIARLFEQRGDQRYCWCAYFRVRGSEFSNASKAEHRAVLERATLRDDAEGRAPGLVAYDGDRAVGWVSVGPREDYLRLTFSKVLAPVDDAPVWSIVCFVVDPAHRRQGIANSLLAGAIDYARAHGATMLEAYPADVAAGERIPDGIAFKGTTAMFERAGFEVVDRRRWNPTTPVRPIVRRGLDR